MASPARFPNGVTNVGPSDPFAQFLSVSPLKMQMYFNDFHTYNATDWLVTLVDTDTDSGDTRTIDATEGGVLNILNNDAAADSTNLALGGAGAEPFLMTAGKKAWIGARFSSGDVSETFMAIGLAPISDVDLAGGLPADHIIIKVDTNDGNVDVSISKDSVATTATAVGTVTDYSEGTNDLTEVVLYYDGRNEVQVFVDGVKVTTMSAATWPDDEEMTLQMEVHNSEAVADNMVVDWVLVAKQR